MNLWDEVKALLDSSAADVVRLAWMEDPSPDDLRALDLRALVEYERKPGGAVRVKLVDRGDLMEAVYKAHCG